MVQQDQDHINQPHYQNGAIDVVQEFMGNLSTIATNQSSNQYYSSMSIYRWPLSSTTLVGDGGDGRYEANVVDVNVHAASNGKMKDASDDNDDDDVQVLDDELVVVDYADDGDGRIDDFGNGQQTTSTHLNTPTPYDQHRETLSDNGENDYVGSNEDVIMKRHHHRHRSVSDTIDDNNRKKTQLPVLVLLTGESYDWNPGSIFDPSILASFGQVVVVTLNFRLGILGKNIFFHIAQHYLVSPCTMYITLISFNVIL